MVYKSQSFIGLVSVLMGFMFINIPVMVFYERLIKVGNHPLLNNALVEIIIILVV